MGKKKRKDLTEENVTNTDVGFGEMAIQHTITNCSDIGKNTDAIVERIGAKLKNIGTIEERIGAKLDRLIKWFRPLLEEKAAVIIQAFLRTMVVRVKLDRAEQLWARKNVHFWVRYTAFTLGPWWKDYRARMKAQERAAAQERAPAQDELAGT